MSSTGSPSSPIRRRFSSCPNWSPRCEFAVASRILAGLPARRHPKRRIGLTMYDVHQMFDKKLERVVLPSSSSRWHVDVVICLRTVVGRQPRCRRVRSDSASMCSPSITAAILEVWVKKWNSWGACQELDRRHEQESATFA
jgi:hypothetical protein